MRPPLLAPLLALMMLIGLVTVPGERAEAAGSCSGHFVNPITDICWSCLFPLSIGALNAWPSSKPDTPNPSLPVCACGSPIPRIGIATGFWEPVRLADVTMKPWCFVNLGGLKLDPGFDIGHKTMAGPSLMGGNAQDTGQWNIHWYIYPLVYWLELVDDFACLEEASFDIGYVTEIDPLWQDSELTMIINPEAAIFANPVAIAACSADCAAATVHLPVDELFWCSGCQGGMYPMNGNIPAQEGHIQGSELALARFMYKLHRQLIMWGTAGSQGMCGKYPMPIMKKSQYRVQMTNPVPTVSGPLACPPVGASTVATSPGHVYPGKGEDMGYLVWRKRNCCVL